jgi:hypothetical protein
MSSNRDIPRDIPIREATPIISRRPPPGRHVEHSPNFGDIEDEHTANRDNAGGIMIPKPLIASGNRFGEATHT